jgi:hypothetical protein
VRVYQIKHHEEGEPRELEDVESTPQDSLDHGRGEDLHETEEGLFANRNHTLVQKMMKFFCENSMLPMTRAAGPERMWMAIIVKLARSFAAAGDV